MSEAVKYSTDEILGSKKYRPYVDLLACTLEEHGKYTEEELSEIIKKTLAQKERKTINR